MDEKKKKHTMFHKIPTILACLALFSKLVDKHFYRTIFLAF